MSRADHRHYWKRLRCDGCTYQCRYRAFHVFPGAPGVGGRRAYRELRDSLWRTDDDPSTWRYRRRGTMLGMMHATKLAAWTRYTQACREAQDALAYG
jgi:hypothetical protein